MLAKPPGELLVMTESEEDLEFQNGLAGALHSVLELLTDTLRFLQLLAVFVPLALAAPFMLHRERSRPHWFRRLRCAAGSQKRSFFFLIGKST